MSTPRDNWIEIGRVARCHGVKGWLRLRLCDQESTVLSSVSEVAVGESKQVIKLRGAERDAAGYRILLDGIEDRDGAEKLRGLPVFVERAALPAAGADQVYVADLLGCELVDQAGTKLGTVASAYPGGAYEMLVVKTLDGEALVPLVDGIITEVDVQAGRISCQLPDGLLEINRK